MECKINNRFNGEYTSSGTNQELQNRSKKLRQQWDKDHFDRYDLPSDTPPRRSVLTNKDLKPVIHHDNHITYVHSLRYADKVQSDIPESVLSICNSFITNRDSLNDNKDIEWVEGWHSVRTESIKRAVPSILHDQGFIIITPNSYMPKACYWHPNKPPQPDYFPSTGALIHFRLPRCLLENLGDWIQDPCAGNRFSFNDELSGFEIPHSNNPEHTSLRIMPIQILETYMVRGDLPEDDAVSVIDIRDTHEWPANAA